MADDPNSNQPNGGPNPPSATGNPNASGSSNSGSGGNSHPTNPSINVTEVILQAHQQMLNSLLVFAFMATNPRWMPSN